MNRRIWKTSRVWKISTVLAVTLLRRKKPRNWRRPIDHFTELITTLVQASFHARLLSWLEFGVAVWFLWSRETVPGENLSEQDDNQQQTQPKYDTEQESKPGHIGGRRALSLLRHPYSPWVRGNKGRGEGEKAVSWDGLKFHQIQGKLQSYSSLHVSEIKN